MQSMGKTEDYLEVKVETAEKTLFEGKVSGISSVNAKGDFDIILDHANFITVIKDKLVLFLNNNETKEFAVDMGILRCFDDHVEVFLGIKVLPDR